MATTFTAGQKVRASDLNAMLSTEARYERSSGTQSASTSANTQVQFPTAVRSASDITASGTSNTAFTLAAPASWDVVWTVTASLSLSAATATAELTIATGSTTWSAANVKAQAGTGSLRIEVVAIVPVPAGTTVAVTVNLWQASGGSITIGAGTFPSSIAFKRN